MQKRQVNLNVPLSSALLTVDTRDGLRAKDGFVIDPQNPYDIQIYKSQQLFSGEVERIALTSVNMPWNSPNVNARNNILYVEGRPNNMMVVDSSNQSFVIYNGATNTFVPINIPAGDYTPGSYAVHLAEGIQDAFSVSGQGGTCVGSLDILGRIVLTTSTTVANSFAIVPQLPTVAQLTGFTTSQVNVYFNLNPVITFDVQPNLQMGSSSVVKQSIVDEGFYLPSELASVLQTQLYAMGFAYAPYPGGSLVPITNFTVVWDSTSNTFTIQTNTNNFVVRILPKINQDKGFFISESSGIRRTSTLAEMMGFNYCSSEYADTIKSSYASMLYTTYVDIVSPTLTKNQKVKDSGTSYRTGMNLLARIYISPDRFYSVSNTNIVGTRPFMLYHEFHIPKEIQWEKEEFLPSCNIQVRDDKGEILYTPSVYPELTADKDMLCGNSSYVQMNFLISEAM